jgi:hypothetical protein
MASNDSIFAGALAEALGNGVKGYHQLQALIELLERKGLISPEEAAAVVASSRARAAAQADEIEARVKDEVAR